MIAMITVVNGLMALAMGNVGHEQILRLYGIRCLAVFGLWQGLESHATPCVITALQRHRDMPLATPRRGKRGFANATAPAQQPLWRRRPWRLAAANTAGGELGTVRHVPPQSSNAQLDYIATAASSSVQQQPKASLKLSAAVEGMERHR